MAAKYPQILLANRKADRINTLQEYEQSGGYHGLKAAVSQYDERSVQQLIEAANLLGRGGAGFLARRARPGRRRRRTVSKVHRLQRR